jgi:hypothetical protein
MTTLGFPTNPYLGQTYTVGVTTYVWNGNAWIKYSGLTQSTSTVTVSNTTTSTSTNSGALVVTGGIGVGGSINIGATSTINGSVILTTSTVNLQIVTDGGATTTDAVRFTNTTNSTSTTTGAVIIAGGVGIRGDVYVGGTIVVEHIDIAEATMDSTYTEVDTMLPTVIDQYPTNIYRSAKYLVQIDEGTGDTADFEVIELLVLVTNTGTVVATDYGLLTNNGELGSFSTMVDGSDPLNPMLKLYFTPYASTNKTITVLRTAVTK